MIQDFRDTLAASGIATHPKIIMEGFSASGMFVNRFCILHPERVLAATAGAPGGFPMLPVEEYKGERLRYPVGIADLDTVAGRPFEAEAFSKVRLMIYMGEEDKNDSVPYADSFEPGDSKLIISLFGDNVLERFRKVEEIYEEAGFKNVEFKVYPGVGHRIMPGMWEEFVGFYSDAIKHKNRNHILSN
jgi:pimeloyl-ACP methyl ester carboxylesterase